MFEATKKWLKERLGLDISPEKSKIVNLKKEYSYFLGFKIKVHKKGKYYQNKQITDRYVIESHVSEKAIEKIQSKAKTYIKGIEFSPNRNAEYKAVSEYNSFVMGIHNYYRMASCVSSDFRTLSYGIKTSIKIRLRDRIKNGIRKRICQGMQKTTMVKAKRFDLLEMRCCCLLLTYSIVRPFIRIRE